MNFNKQQCIQRRFISPVLTSFLLLLFSAFCLLGSVHIARAGTYIVSSNADSGSFTLRSALIAANGDLDPDNIVFQLPANATVIQLATALPTISTPIQILGESQSGSVCDTDDPRATVVKVVLDGSAVGANAVGFFITSNNVRVSGLNIRNFGGSGIRISGTDDVQIVCNFIGTNVTGTAAAANGIGIIMLNPLIDAPVRNLIQGNLVSGNTLSGITIQAAIQITVSSNFVGTDSSGSVALGNGFRGIDIQNTDLISITNSVISANTSEGLFLSSVQNATIDRNKIGTNFSGTAPLGNNLDGVFLSANSNQNTIGGPIAASANLISGNHGRGIGIEASPNNTVTFNIIGLNGVGAQAFPNDVAGIGLSQGANQNSIGQNTISGNNGYGILVDKSFTNTLSNNLIGTNSGGTQGVSNDIAGVALVDANANTLSVNHISGNAGDGLILTGSSGNRILANRFGGDLSAANAIPNTANGVVIEANSSDNLLEGNLSVSNLAAGVRVSGSYSNTLRYNYFGVIFTQTSELPNGGDGIILTDGTTNTLLLKNVVSGNGGVGVRIENASNNRLYSNKIGVDVDGVAVGNQSTGVLLINASNNTIGDKDIAPNVIANNFDKGIWISDTASTGNWIAENSIYSNTGLGIDLDPVGITANDAGDGDSGPNRLQNFPVLSGAESISGSTVVTGSLNSTPSTPYVIEFFSNTPDMVDCEGASFVGFVLVTTTVAGNASFTSTLPNLVPSGHKLSATAKDLITEDTSEFSACTTVTGVTPPSPVVSLSPFNRVVSEGAGVATLTVQFSISTTVPVTVYYSASNSSPFPGPTDALAGSDFISVSKQSVVVPAGQLSATISISITDDASVEPTENFLSSIELPPGSIATLDFGNASSVVSITDNDGVNAPPVANAQIVTAAVGTAKAITLTGSDPNSNPLTFTVVSTPAHGTLSGVAPTLTYSPAVGFTGIDSFTFKVNNGTQDSNVAMVSIVVTATTPVDSSKKIYLPITLSIGDPVFVGAGDIAVCSLPNDVATANLLDSIIGTVFVLGDNAYESGTLAQYNTCYDPTWGRHKARTMPVPGNHEYLTSGAAGYYTYFGAAASPQEVNCTSNCKGYYSYDLGTWHIIALNSEIDHTASSAQLTWLKADLAAHNTVCTLAYWHKPYYSSGAHGGDSETPSFKTFWDVLYASGVDVVLNGHDHNYERFAPQDPTGQADSVHGIREFVVGTGGQALRGFDTIRANSEVRNSDTFGVLKLTLHAGSYSWAFIPIAGQTFTDSGTANCVSP